MTDAAKALQHETTFLSGVQANLETAKGKYLRGKSWQHSHHDESDRLRRLLAENKILDRRRLKSLPANRRIALHGFENRLLFWKRRTGVAIASTMSPMSHYASSPDSDGPPVGLGELVDHVRQLAGDARVPHLIGVCSTTGFTDEARNVHLDLPNVELVLIEPDGHGGWQTTAPTDEVAPQVLKIFDPEQANNKVDRVRAAIEERSADLLTGSLSASSLMSQTSLPKEIIRQGFEQAAKADPELKMSEKDGELLLFRGAPVQHQEKKSMSVIDRIKQLLSGEGDEGEKINLLAERRAALAQRRGRIYEDIGQLENREADLLAQGKAATSPVPKRRLAAQLAQLRKDIARQNTSAAMLNKQIDIISTDIHNLTLIQQGEMAQLPDTTELTENAVRAEEMLETLSADADLVGGLETGLADTLTSDEELAILKEFEGAEAVPAADDKVKTPPTAVKKTESPQAERTSPAPAEGLSEEPPSSSGDPKERRADAEPT